MTSEKFQTFIYLDYSFKNILIYNQYNGLMNLKQSNQYFPPVSKKHRTVNPSINVLRSSVNYDLRE